MWDFPQYTSGERAFSFFRGTLETTGAGTGVEAGAGTRAGAGTGARAFKTALRICCKSSLEYLGILVSAEGELARSFAPEGLAGWLNNLSPDSGGGKELRRAMKEATEGATEKHSCRERPRRWTKVILALTF